MIARIVNKVPAVIAQWAGGEPGRVRRPIMSWHKQLDTALMLSLFPPTPAIGADAFSGTWHYVQCGKVNRESDCRGLTLILIQDGSRLCGVHGIHATPPVGNVQLDDGPGPSVSGTLRGNSAVIVLLHGRTGALAKAEISLDGGKLLWKLVEGPEGDPYLPDTAVMVPALYSRFAAEAKRKCARSPNATAEGDARKSGAHPSP